MYVVFIKNMNEVRKDLPWQLIRSYDKEENAWLLDTDTFEKRRVTRQEVYELLDKGGVIGVTKGFSTGYPYMKFEHFTSALQGRIYSYVIPDNMGRFICGSSVDVIPLTPEAGYELRYTYGDKIADIYLNHGVFMDRLGMLWAEKIGEYTRICLCLGVSTILGQSTYKRYGIRVLLILRGLDIVGVEHIYCDESESLIKSFIIYQKLSSKLQTKLSLVW